MNRNSALIGALALILAPCPSFAVTVNTAHTGGCPTTFFDSTPTTFPIFNATPCAVSQDFSGNILTTTSTLQSRVDLTSIGASLDYSVELDAIGPISITPSSGVWAFVRSVLQQQITVSGGLGDAVLRLGYDVHGVSDVSDFLPGSFFNVLLEIDSTVDEVIQNTSSFSGFLDIPFTYDTPFDLSLLFDLRLIGPALATGTPAHLGPYSASADFLNSADFAFAVFDEQLSPVIGSTITSDNGFVFPQATSMPEPTTLALFGAGLAGLAVIRRRRKAKA
jgi:hypothetical protein